MATSVGDSCVGGGVVDFALLPWKTACAVRVVRDELMSETRLKFFRVLVFCASLLDNRSTAAAYDATAASAAEILFCNAF